MRHACLLAALVALALAAGVPQATTRPRGEKGSRTEAVLSAASFRRSLAVIERYRDTAWHWQRLMGTRRTPYLGDAERSISPRFHSFLQRLWRKRQALALRRAQNPPHKREWLCIHAYEGAWNDPNSPYFGGLQMDLEFQRTYGPELLRRKGTADRWTPLEQMWVAERAHRSGRGFYPWPNTARWCGLLG